MAPRGSSCSVRAMRICIRWSPWIVLLIALAVGAFLRALGRALGGHCSLPRYTVSLRGPVGRVCGLPVGGLHLPGVPRGHVRDGPPGRTGRDLRLRRLVGGSGRARHRAGARCRVPGRPLGAPRDRPSSRPHGWPRSARRGCSPALPATCCCPGRRRWRGAVRAAVLLADRAPCTRHGERSRRLHA